MTPLLPPAVSPELRSALLQRGATARITPNRAMKRDALRGARRSLKHLAQMPARHRAIFERGRQARIAERRQAEEQARSAAIREHILEGVAIDAPESSAIVAPAPRIIVPA